MKPRVVEHDIHTIKLAHYSIGFVSCMALTLLAYLLVERQAGSTGTIVAFITGLAVVQFVVQMVLFLHVSEEHAPRWKFQALMLMLFMVFILVAGTLWVMNNLNYRMMSSPDEQQQYLRETDGF